MELFLPVPAQALHPHHRMGHTGISQLHIGDIALPVQIQSAGLIEPHPVLAFRQPLAVDQSGVGLHHHLRSGDAHVIGEPADASGTVAAHLATGAVGIVEMELEISLFGMVHRHEAVGPADLTGLHRQIGKVHLQPPGIDHHKIIARTVHVVGFHHRPSCSKDTGYEI